MVLPPFPDEESEEEKLSFTQFRLSFRASIFSSSSILARVAGSGDFSFLAYERWVVNRIGRAVPLAFQCVFCKLKSLRAALAQR